jgi:hypothetical protein
MERKLRVVYLFGAGATDGERIAQISDESDAKKRANGLLNRDIAKRVIQKMHTKLSRTESFSHYELSGYDNIEQLIALIESVNTEEAVNLSSGFREAFKRDLIKRTEDLNPFLYYSLLELQETREDEEVIGYVTLNYDYVFDKALDKFAKKHGDVNVDYGIDTVEYNKSTKLYPVLLLKLNGSIGWGIKGGKINPTNKKGIVTNSWIPPGLTKNYLNYPYNKIWGRATELFQSCDVLRAIGCSFSPDDQNFRSFIFRTQVNNRYKIEVLNGEDTDEIRDRLPFLINIYGYEAFVGYDLDMKKEANYFNDWLGVAGSSLPPEKIANTRYLKDIKVKT